MSAGPRIDLWAISFNAAERDPVLSDAERRRAAGISNARVRTQYERTRSSVRKILGRTLAVHPADLEFVNLENGKPAVVSAADCEFSISHSGDFLVIATSDSSVGVDIETRAPEEGGLALAERFFSATDFGVLRGTSSAGRSAAFLRQWVAKEAALKAIGCGIADVLVEAKCDYRAEEICAVRWREECVAVRPFALDDGTPGAVAWRGPGEMPFLSWRDGSELTA